MKILSIETCSHICAAAILEDETCIKEICLDNGLTHSETLMPIIEQILVETNLKLSDIDLLVCDVGPGSFTGIRIGVATVKAFIDSLDILSVGVSSLEALALNVSEKGIICSLIDAKKGNVYASIFEHIDNNYNIKCEPTFENINDFLIHLKELEPTNIIFVGDGAIKNKDIILSTFPDSKFSKNNDLSSINVGIAGFNHYKNNSCTSIDPLYIRKSEAEIKLEEKQNGTK